MGANARRWIARSGAELIDIDERTLDPWRDLGLGDTGSCKGLLLLEAELLASATGDSGLGDLLTIVVDDTESLCETVPILASGPLLPWGWYTTAWPLDSGVSARFNILSPTLSVF